MEHLWSEVNIGSGNGLLPSDSKPLPEPLLTPDLCHIELMPIYCEINPYGTKPPPIMLLFSDNTMPPCYMAIFSDYHANLYLLFHGVSYI